MPFGDGTGPWGLGPLTGRRLGYCAGYPVPGANNPIGYWGYGFGFGRGRGFRNRFWATGIPGWAWARGLSGVPYPYPPVSPYFPAGPVDEKEALKAQAAYLEEQLAAIQRRLGELERQADPEKKGKDQE